MGLFIFSILFAPVPIWTGPLFKSNLEPNRFIDDTTRYFSSDHRCVTLVCVANTDDKFLGVRREIFWLGVVSFFTDLSSEMIFSVLSLFMTVVLGASTAVVGMMEGLADFAASSLDFASGYLSDRTGKRKIFVVAGYAFSAAAKIILVVAHSVPWVFFFRVVERLGKSVRGAPRDALIAHISENRNRGYSFGVHKAMDKAGAVLGPLLAYALLSLLGEVPKTFTLLFILSVILAFLAVFVLVISIPETPVPVDKRVREGLFSAYRSLGRSFHTYLKVSAFFSLSYFGFAFLLLRAYDVGFAVKDVALLYALFNLSFVLVSIPAGSIGDRLGRKGVLAAEYFLYAVLCAGFAFAKSRELVVLLFVVYGIFYAIDEGQTKAYISEITPARFTASAIGIYNFVTGALYFPASVIAGALWKYSGPSTAFLFAAVVAALSWLGFVLFCREGDKNGVT